MELAQAQDLFDEIIEQCHLVDSSKLIETAESLYHEVNNAQKINQVISACEEIMVIINDIDVPPEDESSIMEIKSKVELISE